MKLKIFLFFISYCLFFQLYLPSEERIITFNQLKDAEHFILENNRAALSDYFKDYQNKVIKIRGFLYKSADGKWILASEPNLKSCCIGNSKNSLNQISVNLTEDLMTDRVVELKGIFEVNTEFNLLKKQEVYKLKDAHSSEQKGVTYTLYIYMSVFFFLLAVFYFFKWH